MIKKYKSKQIASSNKYIQKYQQETKANKKKTYLQKVDSKPDEYYPSQQESQCYDGQYQQDQGFPHTRQDVLRRLKTLPGLFQRMYTTQQCSKMFQQALNNMQDYDYDFTNSTKPITQLDDYKTMKKQVYLQFQCENRQCEKKFSSIVGTFQVKFYVEKLKLTNSKQMNKIIKNKIFPYNVNYNVRIYRMQCLRCFQYVEPRIFDSQLEACQIAFCLIIDQIMRLIPPPQRIFKGKRYIKDIHWHKEDHCQACQEGQCVTRRNQQLDKKQLKDKKRKKRLIREKLREKARRDLR